MHDSCCIPPFILYLLLESSICFLVERRWAGEFCDGLPQGPRIRDLDWLRGARSPMRRQTAVAKGGQSGIWACGRSMVM